MHGTKQLTVSGEKSAPTTVGITFYLLEDGRILNYRQWNWANKPNYLIHGSHDGCVAYKQKMEAKKLQSA